MCVCVFQAARQSCVSLLQDEGVCPPRVCVLPVLEDRSRIQIVSSHDSSSQLSDLGFWSVLTEFLEKTVFCEKVAKNRIWPEFS